MMAINMEIVSISYWSFMCIYLFRHIPELSRTMLGVVARNLEKSEKCSMRAQWGLNLVHTRANRLTGSQKLHYLVGITKKTWQASRNTNDPQDMCISHLRQTQVLLLVLVNTFHTIIDPMLAYPAPC